MQRQFITSENLYNAVKSGLEVLIIDLRTASRYKISHLKNSINIDFYNPSFKSKIKKLEKNISTIIYCENGNTSFNAYNFFLGEGFSEVFILVNGFSGWESNFFPIIRI